MAVLKLFLVRKFIPENEMFEEGWQYACSQTLLTYFGQALAKTPFSSVDYFWEGAASDVTKFDLVCYLLSTQKQSIIVSLEPNRIGTLGGGGTTLLLQASNTVISEIYMESISGDAERHNLLANLIFHEWMHNVLEANSPKLQDVHKVLNGVLGVGAPLRSNMRASPGDIAAMNRGLKRKHLIPQFSERM